MIALTLAVLAGVGVFLLYTAVAFGWHSVGPRSRRGAGHGDLVARWLREAGLDGVSPREFGAVMAALGLLSAGVSYVLFGGWLTTLVAGMLGALGPIGAYRSRRSRRRSEAREAWPRLIEEIRVLTGAGGRSIPQALVEVGRRAPEELRAAFAAAEREWLVTTDFEATVAVLKRALGDPTADATAETLLVAHQIGGADLDRRLAALLEDRILDVQGRKDARAKQAGVRFARRFVLAVPIGMALAGLSIGSGRSAYQSPLGQLAVLVGLAAVAGCWGWAGWLLRLPEEERVFVSGGTT